MHRVRVKRQVRQTLRQIRYTGRNNRLMWKAQGEHHQRRRSMLDAVAAMRGIFDILLDELQGQQNRKERLRCAEKKDGPSYGQYQSGTRSGEDLIDTHSSPVAMRERPRSAPRSTSLQSGNGTLQLKSPQDRAPGTNLAD